MIQKNQKDKKNRNSENSKNQKEEKERKVRRSGNKNKAQTQKKWWAHSVRHEYEYCDVCVNRSDDNMLEVFFQESQLTSDPTTTPQQCNKGDRQRCQSS